MNAQSVEYRYEANHQTIGMLLSATSPRIEVPEWQRSYSWQTPEVETFWHDLLSFDGRHPNDNIVGREYFLGSIVLVTGGPSKLLLDGQQRLATATILLSAIRDAIAPFKADAATRLQSKYICDFDDAKNVTTPTLTLNIYDRDFFWEEIQCEPNSRAASPTPTLRSHGLVRKTRRFFDEQIRRKCEEFGGGQPAYQWCLRIARVLCDHMSLVAVSSTDEDNAAAVFETLNDRGIGLSTPDLLRNFLVRRAGTPINRRTVVAAWQEILSINEDASVDEYLRHYWVSHHGDVKSRKLYREIKAILTDQDVDAALYSRELAKEALVYREIVAARSDNPALRRHLISIRELGAKVLYPALLAGYSAADNDEASDGLLEMSAALVTLFVRYNVVSKRETTILEETVYSVASRLRISKDFDQAVNDLLELVPSLSEFREQFLELSLKRRATARYLLREIEVAKRHTQEISIEDSDRVHVEHIYPRNPVGRKWSDHSKYVDRLGNLTLLARRLNTSIRNTGFAEKREAYGKSAILLASELADIEKWNVQAITARQKELSKFAERVWSVPRDSQGAVHESDGVVEGPGALNQDTRGAGDEIDPEELPETPEA